MFISSASYAGNFGGTATGDSNCATLATAAGLDGTWKSWTAVTTGTDDPATRFTHPTTAYKLVDGTTTIANNWTGLASGTLVAGISKNESGTAVTAGSFVWTNVTASSGTITATVSGSNSAGNCSGWTITGSGTKKGYYGVTSSATATWTHSSSQTCSSTARLYCIEQ